MYGRPLRNTFEYAKLWKLKKVPTISVVIGEHDTVTERIETWTKRSAVAPLLKGSFLPPKINLKKWIHKSQMKVPH